MNQAGLESHFIGYSRLILLYKSVKMAHLCTYSNPGVLNSGDPQKMVTKLRLLALFPAFWAEEQLFMKKNHAWRTTLYVKCGISGTKPCKTYYTFGGSNVIDQLLRVLSQPKRSWVAQADKISP